MKNFIKNNPVIAADGFYPFPILDPKLYWYYAPIEVKETCLENYLFDYYDVEPCDVTELPKRKSSNKVFSKRRSSRKKSYPTCFYAKLIYIIEIILLL